MLVLTFILSATTLSGMSSQMREYLKGVEPSAPHLAMLGASPEQIADFERIMAAAAERIIRERPDQTRH